MMGKLSKGWALVREVIGPFLTEKLQNGHPIDIAAENGQIYRIDPRIQRLVNLTTREKYCVHPKDGMDYCFPDMIVLWWDYLHLKVNALESAVGGVNDGHRTPYMEGFPTVAVVNNHGVITYSPDYSAIIKNPLRAFEMLPPFIVQKFDVMMSTFIKFQTEGGISGGIEVQEVVENDEEVEENTEGEVASVD